MSTSILATKLYTPRPRSKIVGRPHLIERLNAGQRANLTLISAPAGFGKTTLISEWLASSEQSVAWLSLDEKDSDTNRFLNYIIATLQSVERNIGEQVLPLLQSPQPTPIEALLTTLINELATLKNNIILVLDDYHIIESQAIDHALTFLLDHLPPQMHVVITTREDPVLPLARYRARGQMTELRAADLRFTPAETAEFLNHVMNLHLSTEAVVALEARTEGWIAGLQLAAISMQGRADTDRFIQAFTGSHHFILDYLMEEVLQGQPESIRTFLLQTSILNRLHGSLCTAVCFEETTSRPSKPGVISQVDGKALIATLARSNLFVVPLDDEHQWYRYHHLFADMLQARLKEDEPERVPVLHQRASEWYEQHGFRTEAIHHALAANDFAKAADLVELTWPTRHRSEFRSAELLDWLETIPDDFIRARPSLSVGYAWELLNGGQFEAAETQLQNAERWMTLTDDASADPKSVKFELDGLVMVVSDEVEFRLLPTEIASARAYLAQAFGDVAATITYAQRALDLIPNSDHIRRGPGASLLGLAYWTRGNLEDAYDALAEGMASFQRAGNILFAISGTFGLADIRIGQGRLHAAIDTYKRALHLVETQGEPTMRGIADLHLGLSELYREQNKQEDAQEHLLKSQNLGANPGQQVYDYRWCLVQAQQQQRNGDLEGAMRFLDQAEALFIHIHIPDLRPIAALRARARLAHSRVADALHWVHEHNLTIDDDLAYVTEFEYLTLARTLIAHYQHTSDEAIINQATFLLSRLLNVAEAGERNGSVIEILILQALAYAAQADMSTALVSLERALTLAEPEGYVLTFVDEGQPMAHLLSELAARGTMKDYVGKLLATFENPAHDDQQMSEPSPSNNQHPSSLIEPLSERELDVLRLLKTYMNGPEIARELMISLNTMRTHTKNIYHKLGVNNRQAAVQRAEELALD
ncbi:MAG: LuxR C-terminal-related transcriptional regulator [Chloroflexota bacterium]